jgi:hypothetical protein
MKLQVVIVAMLVLAAGPASAEFGTYRPKSTWTPGGASAPRPTSGYGVPAPASAPAYSGPTTSRIYGPPATPKAEPFKPYQPYKPFSVYGAQKKR